MGKLIHPILKYLDDTGETQVSLSSRVSRILRKSRDKGISKQHLNGFIKGKSRLGNGKVIALSQATRGVVSVEELVAWSAKVKRARRRR